MTPLTPAEIEEGRALLERATTAVTVSGLLHARDRLASWCNANLPRLLAVAEERQWRPIETAPKDGTWFIGHGDGPGFELCPVIAHWYEGGWRNVYRDKPRVLSPH